MKRRSCGTCLQLALCRQGQVQLPRISASLGEFLLKSFKQHHVSMRSGWEPGEKQWPNGCLVWRTNYGTESHTSGWWLHVHLSCILVTRALLWWLLGGRQEMLCRARLVCGALGCSSGYPAWQGLTDPCWQPKQRSQGWSDAQQEASLDNGLPHLFPATQRTECPPTSLPEYIRHCNTKWILAKDQD